MYKKNKSNARYFLPRFPAAGIDIAGNGNFNSTSLLNLSSEKPKTRDISINFFTPVLSILLIGSNDNL